MEPNKHSRTRQSKKTCRMLFVGILFGCDKIRIIHAFLFKQLIAMEVDAEKLIFLVEQRSAIYNFHLKEHSNKIYIDKLWEEIAAEINSTVSECKTKWTCLRSAYCRQLREERIKPSKSSGKQRKRWYLADAMEFLKDYIHQHRSTSGSLDDINDNDIIDEAVAVDSPGTSTSQIPLNTVQNSNTTSKRFKPSDLVAGPMIEFLQSKTKSKETSNSLFMKSMLADLENLKKPNQRKFKKLMSDVMYQLQEEEEEDENTVQDDTGNNVQMEFKYE